MEVNRLLLGSATDVLATLPGQSIDLVITSPPYWTAVTYGTESNFNSYDDYLQAMLDVWQQCERVLRPNGKLCINTLALPIPKKIIQQHTRHLKNIPYDIDQTILTETSLQRYSQFIWQKQCSRLMFGSYPYPGNIIENTTTEAINVYVKPGKPPKFPRQVREANRMTRDEWLDFTQQVWFMYPADVKRGMGHPAPFPLKLPARLIRMYTYGRTDDFAGEIVLDPFMGTGTTCVVAKALGRRYLGIDIHSPYLQLAQARLDEPAPKIQVLVGRPKYPRMAELEALPAARSRGRLEGIKRHRKASYGRASGVEESLSSYAMPDQQLNDAPHIPERIGSSANQGDCQSADSIPLVTP